MWFTGDPEALAWLKAQADNPGTDIISICTGIFICGEAGVLEGKTACGPREAQELLAKQFETQRVKWVGEEWRWAHDGNFWSSGELFRLCLFSRLFFASRPDRQETD